MLKAPLPLTQNAAIKFISEYLFIKNKGCVNLGQRHVRFHKYSRGLILAVVREHRNGLEVLNLVFDPNENLIPVARLIERICHGMGAWDFDLVLYQICADINFRYTSRAKDLYEDGSNNEQDS